MSSLSQFMGEKLNFSTTNPKKQAPQLDPLAQENGIAEFNAGKRKIIWKLKNVKG